MFNKLKQFKDLRDQAKKMQNVLGQESVTVDKNGVYVTINGNLEITSIKLNAELSADKQAEVIKDLLNDAIKKVQRIMAEKMRSMGGFPGLQ